MWLHPHHHHFHLHFVDVSHSVVLGLLTVMLTVVMDMLRSCSATLTNLPHR